ncbi:MAG TPA: Pvc16 family protein [Pseudonocardiaceae bacterium]
MTSVISDVGRALRTLLRPRLPGEAAVHLGVPADERGLYLTLQWLREDPSGRQSGLEDVRAGDGSLLGRQAPARRYELRYLVTARAESVEDEHELLDAVLLAVTDLEALPADCLPKGLADAGLPVRVAVCAEPLGGAAPPAGGGFALLVNAPLLPPLQTELAPPAAELAMGLRRTVPPLVPAASGSGRQWRRARIEED